MNKKICFVTTTRISIESFFVPQIKYLAKNGFDVTVVCTPKGDMQGLLGDTVRYVPIDIPRGISFFGSFSAISKMKKFFKKERFDIVQYSTPNAAMYASIASRLTGVKIRNYHIMGFRYLGSSGIGGMLLKAIEMISCKNSTDFECVSPSNRKFGIENGFFTEENSCVVWNGSSGGVDLKKFDVSKRTEYRNEIRSRHGIKNDEFVFGFVGRVTRDKGINEILSAFKKMNGAKLLMVGDLSEAGTLDSALYSQSKENESIIYTNEVSDVEKYMAAIDVLLFPSYREGFGNVVIEAASMKTPAIVSDIMGPIDAVLKDESAIVVPPHDEASLADAMSKVMNDIDIAKMGNTAYDFVKSGFDSDIMCQKVLERKNELIKRLS
ncbi:MAG: glycosyltransferase family 4 protein [Clostridia bacterium]|nr:glycosyltransferase family 4 protein [Clostridia bacterium]